MTRSVEQVRRLAQEHGSNLALVVNHSGGKDSTRMLGLVRQSLPSVRTYAVMADTGFEHEVPVSAEDWARSRCAEFGLDLTVVRNPKRTYLEMVEQRGMFPSPQSRHVPRINAAHQYVISEPNFREMHFLVTIPTHTSFREHYS